MKKRKILWRIALGVLLCGLALFLYARWEYGAIRVVQLALEADDPRLAGIRIVYAADFQYDMRSNSPQSLREKDFQKAVDLIMAQQPDLILLGGDYGTFPSNWEAVARPLAALEAPLGVFGVFGNHDSGTEVSLAKALPNIRFLANQAVMVAYNGAVIEISGVEDLWHGRPALPESSAADYRVLLTHNPDFFETLPGARRARYDLTLAGHTHAGQVTFFGWRAFPPAFSGISRYGEKYRYGEKDYGGRIYITSGLGGAVFRVPIRFGARPEVVLIQAA